MRDPSVSLHVFEIRLKIHLEKQSTEIVEQPCCNCRTYLNSVKKKDISFRVLQKLRAREISPL